MAQVTLPYTLTAGQPQNVNQLNSNLNALVTGVNRVESTQIAPTIQTVSYATADQSLTTTPTALTGVSLTVVPSVAATALVFLDVTVSISASGAPAGNAAVNLYLDGVIQSPGIWVGTSASNFVAISTSVIVPMTLSAASHSITVQVSRDANLAGSSNIGSLTKAATRLTSVLFSQ